MGLGVWGLGFRSGVSVLGLGVLSRDCQVGWVEWSKGSFPYFALEGREHTSHLVLMSFGLYSPHSLRGPLVLGAGDTSDAVYRIVRNSI